MPNAKVSASLARRRIVAFCFRTRRERVRPLRMVAGNITASTNLQAGAKRLVYGKRSNKVMARMVAVKVQVLTAIKIMSMGFQLARKIARPPASARVSVSLPPSQIGAFCTPAKMFPVRLSKMVDTISHASTSLPQLGQKSNDKMVAPDVAKTAVRTATKLSLASGRVNRHATAPPNARASALRLRAVIVVFCTLSRRQAKRTFPMVVSIMSASTSLSTRR